MSFRDRLSLGSRKPATGQAAEKQQAKTRAARSRGATKADRAGQAWEDADRRRLGC